MAWIGTPEHPQERRKVAENPQLILLPWLKGNCPFFQGPSISGSMLVFGSVYSIAMP